MVKDAEISPPVAGGDLGVSGQLGSFGGFPQQPHSSMEETLKKGKSTHV